MKPVRPSVRVSVPSSLSNLGPGFDILGMAVNGWAETVVARISEQSEATDRIAVYWHPDSAWHGSAKPFDNAAVVAAGAVLDHLGIEARITLEIRKAIKPGSGLGSSAASAVAGAVAVNALFGEQFSKAQLVDACLQGESRASGARHGDNVIPALFGGLTACFNASPGEFARIPVPDGLFIALILPDVQILTAHARAELPDSIPLRTATSMASQTILLLEAFRRGDWETAGRFIMSDQVVEPVRARTLPVYDAVRSAMMAAGAYGAALSGSGPAMFALADSLEGAQQILEAAVSVCRCAGMGADGRVVQTDVEGARILDDA